MTRAIRFVALCVILGSAGAAAMVLAGMRDLSPVPPPKTAAIRVPAFERITD